MGFVGIPGARAKNIFFTGGKSTPDAGEMREGQPKRGSFDGGADQDRTGDLLNAIHRLYRHTYPYLRGHGVDKIVKNGSVLVTQAENREDLVKLHAD